MLLRETIKPLTARLDMRSAQDEPFVDPLHFFTIADTQACYTTTTTTTKNPSNVEGLVFLL